MKDRTNRALLAFLILPLLALAAALVTQYGFDMRPCAWCVLQRLIFACIAVVAAVALLVRGQKLRTGLITVIWLFAASGIASALYQHFVAARSTSCRRSLAEYINGWLHLESLLPSVFGIRASCADAATTLLGLPYEYWSLALFTIIAVWSATLVLRKLLPAGRRAA